ncbi:MAG TPA: mercuric reductase [Pirellulales bacterium]|nr:mercuric reductase [Pirellulales bacterium]
MQLLPTDEFDQLLIAHAHPPEWTNPSPEGRYNLVAVGGGTAGIVAALGAAALGGRAALVERDLLGGDCLNAGCVPSKALLSAARAAHLLTQGEQFGFHLAGPPRVDFAEIMRRMRRMRSQISRHDSAQRFAVLGVDVYFGEATFTGPDTLEVAGRQLRFHRAVIATGTRPVVPAIAGLDASDFLTNETIFALTELPRRLIVVGGGPVGCELAQAFRRFGSEVHLIQRGESLLAKESPDAARRVQSQLEREGVHFCLGWSTQAVERVGDSISMVIERQGDKRKLIADAILIATGRTPNLEGLGLEAAGVRATPDGVEVNERLQTANPRIFAAGDVCSSFKFTHAADAMARLCLRNALFFGRKKFSSLVIPRCTYTDPAVAQVGWTAAEARQRGIEVDCFRVEMAEVDRAVVDGEEAGFAEVLVRRRTGRVVGATVVAREAGELIAEIVLLMTQRRTLAHLAQTIHCYPTQSEVWKRIADSYTRTRLTPTVAKALDRWLAWWRR